MSKILDLAKEFNATSKKEAESITTALQSDLKALESDINTALSESRESLRSAIQESNEALVKEIYDNQRRMGSIMSRTWAWVLGLLLILALGLTIWSMWQGLTIASNWQQISKQEETLQTLADGGGKLQFSRCNGRVCIKIDEKAPTYENGYRIVEGY